MVWVQLVSTYKKPDHYYAKAKEKGFAARSVFKLQELDEKYKLVRPGDHILDLGAAPGSWLQYLSKKVGPSGSVVGIDLSPVRMVFSNVTLIQMDVFQYLPERNQKFDVIVSDMAPKTTGEKEGDHVRSMELCRRAVEIAKLSLASGGHFLIKMFQGGESDAFLRDLHPLFKTVKTQKPSASRGESREVYVLGLTAKTGLY